MRRLAAALCLCGLLVSGTACGERSEPTGATVDLYPVSLTDAGGTTVVVPHAPRRILALGPAMARTVDALGVGSRSVEAADATPVSLDRFDLVLAWSSSEQAGQLAQRRPTGVATYIAADDSVRDVERSLGDLGVMVGEPLAGRRLVERIERNRRDVVERVGSAPVVSVFLDTGFFATVSTRSLPGDIIREARGRNIAGPQVQLGTPFSVRALARLNPKYYLATSDARLRLADLRKDRRTRRLPAVRAGRFAVVPARLLEPGPLVGEGIAAVARAIHPDAFR